MQLVVKKESLSQLLYLTNTIVERRNTMPILANVKLTADDKSLHVTATDLEVSLVGSTAAEVTTPGTITVSAKFLYDIVRELPTDTVQLKSSKAERLEVEAGKSHFKVNGISSDEFPTVMGINLTQPVSVEAQKLFEMLDKTAYAVSLDETRYNINGVYAEVVDRAGGDKGKKAIRFVATDGHRLALIDRPAEGLNLEKVIIPRKGINELKKVLENNEGAALVSTANGFFTVQSNGVTIGIRLIDGEFPDYRQVLPKEKKTEVRVGRSEFLSTVKRVSLVTTDKSRSIKFRLSDKTLTVSSSSPEYGEAIESIPVDQDGEDVTIGFSARYVLDAVAAMGSAETVIIRLNGELGPGVFLGDSDEEYQCVIMPMRFD